MSLGYTGYAKLKEIKEGKIYYLYSGENWNAAFDEGDSLLYDGIIEIDESSLVNGELAKAIEIGQVKIIKEIVLHIEKVMKKLKIYSKILMKNGKHGVVFLAQNIINLMIPLK